MLTLASLRKAGIAESSSFEEISDAAIELGIHPTTNNVALHNQLFPLDEMQEICGNAIIEGFHSISSFSILSLMGKKSCLGFSDPWDHILPEDIGSCFEVVTEAKPLVQGGKVSLVHKEERRNAGVHHTPFDITERMVDISLQKKSFGDQGIPKPFVICDLAVGAGAFLVQAARILRNISQGSRSMGEILDSHIIGFDIDKHSIMVANLCLHMEAGFPKKPKSYNLHCLDSIGEVNSKDTIQGKIKEMSLDSRGVADITIGNPPYVRYFKDSRKRMSNLGFSTSSTDNLSAIFLEQSLEVTEFGGVVCQIVPISVIQSDKMRPARRLLLSRCSSVQIEAFDCVPGYIFDQGKIGSNSNTSITRQVAIVSAIRGDEDTVVRISRMIRWSSSERDGLFESVETVTLPQECKTDMNFPMLGDQDSLENFKHLLGLKHKISDLYGNTRNSIFIPKAVRYFITGVVASLGRENEMKLSFRDGFSRNLALVVVNSSIFYWYWKVVGNGFQVNLSEISSLGIPNPNSISNRQKKEINRMAKRLSRNRDRLSVVKNNKGKIRNVKYDLDRRLMRDLDDLVDSIYGFPIEGYAYSAYKSNNLSDFSRAMGG